MDIFFLRSPPCHRDSISRILKCFILRIVLSLFVLLCLPQSGVTAPLATPEPVRIGAIFSTSGFAAEHNRPMLEMVELATRELNEHGGILGRPVELVVLNNGSTPIGSLLAATRAVRLGINAVIGAHWSSHSLIIAPILQQAGIPMITPGSTNPEITIGRDYVFRICFLDSQQGTAMARFARNNLQADTAVLFTNIDEDYSVTLASYFRQSFISGGGTILGELTYREKEVDFSPMLKRLKTLKPAVVYLPGYTTDSGLIIRQARKMGLSTIFLGGDAWANIESVSSDSTDGSFLSIPWHPDLNFDGSKKLKETLTKYGKWPPENSSTPLAYDAVMILADAIRRAGTLNSKSIRDALAATKGFPGATGKIEFDHNGDPLHKAIIIVKLEGSKRVLYQIATP